MKKDIIYVTYIYVYMLSLQETIDDVKLTIYVWTLDNESIITN
jgi:hypothetical protein